MRRRGFTTEAKSGFESFYPEMPGTHADGSEQEDAAPEGEEWQSCLDSNQDEQSQNLLCYRYTTGLKASPEEQPPQDSNLERRNQNP